MKTIEEIKELFKDDVPALKKTILAGHIISNIESQQEYSALLDKLGLKDNNKIDEVYTISEDMHIVKTRNNRSETGYWYEPYVSCKPTHNITTNFDYAILIALSHKYDDCNSQAACFMARMLGMKEEE